MQVSDTCESESNKIKFDNFLIIKLNIWIRETLFYNTEFYTYRRSYIIYTGW